MLPVFTPVPAFSPIAVVWDVAPEFLIEFVPTAVLSVPELPSKVINPRAVLFARVAFALSPITVLWLPPPFPTLIPLTTISELNVLFPAIV